MNKGFQAIAAGTFDFSQDWVQDVGDLWRPVVASMFRVHTQIRIYRLREGQVVGESLDPAAEVVIRALLWHTPAAHYDLLVE